jgi:hypothetical protein
LQSPETGSQNRRYRDLGRRQRPHVPHLNPRKCPQIAAYLSETGKHRFASDCVVADALWIEPVSTPKFPANREINREFCGFWRLAAILTPNRRAGSMVYNQIPYATEQGIFKRVSGKSFQGTGNFHARCFDVEILSRHSWKL